MIKRITLTFVALTLLIWAYAALYRAQPAAAQIVTIPTRTPTPAPVTPTNTPPPQPTNPPQPTAPPAATDTPEPEATATNTAVQPTIDPSTLLPTAEACGEPPSARANNNINVRRGPGTDYDILSTLFAGEVRPILGRAEFAEWWVIELADGREGWVASFTVTVNGYTGNVPLVAPPTLNGSTPTPGPLWQPTPQPDCPTATPTTAPTATATAVPPTAAPEQDNTTAGTTQAPETAVTASTTSPPAPPAPLADNAPTATPATTVAITGQQAAATAQPLASDQDQGSNSNLLLIAGIGLIVLGIVGTIVIRR